jgi:isoleucyl-tRNA synthetase
MNEHVAPVAKARDYSETLFLPKTEFPMRAGLPQREPLILERWAELDIYRRLRDNGAGRPRFILHDGPPYANGHIHIGHALNKILKDIVARSQGMLGFDSNYVPGWDCHGLPIEWKIEEEYRAKGQDKDAVPVVEFRRQCRAFAERWIEVQRDEFRRLGVEGDWERYYSTMAYAAEAQIARELMRFAEMGQLYRGSKPVLWSSVERTALAEAEVEYHERVSTTIHVRFPVTDTLDPDLEGASVLIWTTTPWTIPANRAITYGREIAYGLYRVTAAPDGNWAKVGDRFIVADKLAEQVLGAAKVEGFTREKDVLPVMIARCSHPFRGLPGASGFWDFDVPVLPADYVTDDAGTGFVHTAPGHGADDYNTFVKNRDTFADCGTREVPHTIDPDSAFFPNIPYFAGERVFDDKGKDGRANESVIAKLVEAGMLVARGRLRHQYPHSWRSKAPLLFRNTPQWFIPMDKAVILGRSGAESRGPRAGRGALWSGDPRGKLGDDDRGGTGSPRRPLALEPGAAAGYPAQPRARRHQDGAVGAPPGAEPHHRHDRGKARLGDLAPARLGRADHRLRPQGHERGAGRSRGQSGHRRGLRGGGGRRLVRGGRRRAVPEAPRS